MTKINPNYLTQTRQQLQAKADELQSLQELLFTGDASVIDRHKLIIEQIRELKESYQKQCEAFTTELPDGRRLLPQQYEALKTFARRNELKVQDLLKRITIEGGVITHGDFTNMNLTTLSGLGPLSTLRCLDVSDNDGLHSLKGIPTQRLEELKALSCSLTGDHTFLSNAPFLRMLDFSLNTDGLTLDKTQFSPQVQISLCLFD
jgi:hypothetical protein